MVGDDFEAVRFESNRVFVSIWRCPSRLDWGVEIGLLRRKPDPEEGFSVGDLAALGAQSDDVHEWTPMWPDKLLPQALAERAEMLQAAGRAAIAGDHAFFEKLSTARAHQVRMHWRAERLAVATRKADEAFRQKDWTEVVSLLDAFGADLSPAQGKKLEYARKQASSSNYSSEQSP
jgi:hypothetical protein